MVVTHRQEDVIERFSSLVILVSANELLWASKVAHDTDIVHNEALVLAVEYAVHAGNGLDELLALQRLVDLHGEEGQHVEEFDACRRRRRCGSLISRS